MEHPCYSSLLRRSGRRVGALYDEALAPIGVNIAQFSLLRNLARCEPATLTALGRRMELDRSTIGRNMRVLERLGFVAFGRGEDQREAVVTLSDSGRKALADGAPLWEGVQRQVEDRLGAQAEALRAALSAI